MKLPFSALGLAFPLLLLNAMESGAAQVFNSTASNMGHQSGRYDGSCTYTSNVVAPCWTASQSAGDRWGWVQYGPYITSLPAGDNIAEFTLGFPSGSGDMAIVDVYDLTIDRSLASKNIKFTDFVAGRNNKVSLGFNNVNPGHPLEFRVHWNGEGRIDLFHVVVVGQYEVRNTYPMGQLYHNCGRFEGADWSCSVNLDPAAAIMTYGPYANFEKARKYTALFKLKIDDFWSDNAKVATVEVYNFDLNQVIASHIITRQEFTSAYYNYFPLMFYTDGYIGQPTGRLEFRVRWGRASYLKQTDVVIHDWGVGYDPQM
jgi:hypothetical protein